MQQRRRRRHRGENKPRMLMICFSSGGGESATVACYEYLTGPSSSILRGTSELLVNPGSFPRNLSEDGGNEDNVDNLVHHSSVSPWKYLLL
ncbi:hypothetical protein INR49_008286 [Caranx melampygus]|nr:hypothetical protein INR49_008286 [Caranx melampygus]